MSLSWTTLIIRAATKASASKPPIPKRYGMYHTRCRRVPQCGHCAARSGTGCRQRWQVPELFAASFSGSTEANIASCSRRALIPLAPGYNREVRIASVLLLILCLAACQHGIQTNEAVRQGVIDHLKKAGMNVGAMDVTVSSVEFNGNKASAVVSMTAKGIGGMPMSFKYQLEQQDKKWVVTGRDTSGGAAHGNQAAPGANAPGGAMPEAMPGAANPHGGGAAMPSPNDLPPVKKK
jgi:hypothetical protein